MRGRLRRNRWDIRRRWDRCPRRRRYHGDWANVEAGRENEAKEKAAKEKKAKRGRPKGKEYKEQEILEMVAKWEGGHWKGAQREDGSK
jgi:hypothetical protein